MYTSYWFSNMLVRNQILGFTLRWLRRMYNVKLGGVQEYQYVGAHATDVGWCNYIYLCHHAAKWVRHLQVKGAPIFFVYVVATNHGLVSVFVEVFLAFYHSGAWIPIRAVKESNVNQYSNNKYTVIILRILITTYQYCLLSTYPSFGAYFYTARTIAPNNWLAQYTHASIMWLCIPLSHAKWLSQCSSVPNAVDCQGQKKPVQPQCSPIIWIW